MTISTAPPMQQRLASMAAAIHQLIPAAEVRLFGLRAQGKARPDSDVDLLITAPVAWLAQHDRFALLGELWGAVAQPDLSVDLVLHSRSEVARRALEPGSLVHEALRDSVLLMASPEAARLLRIARRDLETARQLLDPDMEEASWGWAAQQCLEKTLKAWIHVTGSKPPATQDIARQLLLLEQAGVDTCTLRPLRAFTSFAVQYRYDDEPEDLSLDRIAWCQRAEALIEQVQALIESAA